MTSTKMLSSVRPSAVAADDLFENQELFPAIAQSYQERGYEEGYARGVNDTLAAFLEEARDFALQQSQPVDETRRLLFAYSEFLEKRVRHSPSPEQHFVDGLGI
jgi:hypothetical protein